MSKKFFYFISVKNRIFFRKHNSLLWYRIQTQLLSSPKRNQFCILPYRNIDKIIYWHLHLIYCWYRKQIGIYISLETCQSLWLMKICHYFFKRTSLIGDTSYGKHFWIKNQKWLVRTQLFSRTFKCLDPVHFRNLCIYFICILLIPCSYPHL